MSGVYTFPAAYMKHMLTDDGLRAAQRSVGAVHVCPGHSDNIHNTDENVEAGKTRDDLLVPAWGLVAHDHHLVKAFLLLMPATADTYFVRFRS